MKFVMKLGEIGKPIQIFKTGIYEHPMYGTIDLSYDRIQRFAENATTNVRGVDLDIDYAHKRDPSKGHKAAGWLRKFEAKEDGLWATPEWTDEAAREIKAGEWKYISADYDDDWQNPENGKVFKDVLNGAALTNRPFIKGMAPVNLAELQAANPDDTDLFDTPDGKYPQDDADYQLANSSMRRCLNCAFFSEGTSSGDLDSDGDGGTCLVVDGVIDPDGISKFFEPIYAESNGFLWDEDEWNEMHKLFRDIPAAERNKIPTADFAGKNRSFPISKCEDVKAAASSMGRAGSDNYDTATLKSNITRIAKRKGFSSCLPKAWQSKTASEGGEMELKEVAVKLGLAEDSDENAVNAKLDELLETTKPNPEDEKAKKFAEMFPDKAKELSDLVEGRKKDSISKLLDDLHSNGMPPKFDEGITEFSMKLTDEDRGTYHTMLGEMVKDGLVPLGEKGNERGAQGTTTADPIQTLVKELQEKDTKLSYRDALKRVLAEHKDLAEAHAKSTRTMSSEAEKDA